MCGRSRLSMGISESIVYSLLFMESGTLNLAWWLHDMCGMLQGCVKFVNTLLLLFVLRAYIAAHVFLCLRLFALFAICEFSCLLIVCVFVCTDCSAVLIDSNIMIACYFRSEIRAKC